MCIVRLSAFGADKEWMGGEKGKDKTEGVILSN